jgi:hypothetical protein
VKLEIVMHDGDSDADGDNTRARERMSFLIRVGVQPFVDGEIIRTPQYVRTHLTFGPAYTGIHEEIVFSAVTPAPG